MKLGGGPLRHVFTIYINQLVSKLAEFFCTQNVPGTIFHQIIFNTGKNRLAGISETTSTAALSTNVILALDSVWVSLKTLNALNAVSSSRTAVTVKASDKKALSGSSYPLGHPSTLKMQSFGRFKL